MKKSLLIIGVTIGGLILAGRIELVAQQIHPNPAFALYYDSASTFNGEPIKVGTVIDAFDPSGVYCGTDTVREDGLYGFMSVYGDDPINTPDLDEGAEPGDQIVFAINGRLATIVAGDPTWGDRAEVQVTLDVANAVIAMETFHLPSDRFGRPGDTVRMQIGVRNIGDGLDYYSIGVSADPAWPVSAQSGFSYAGASEVTYLDFEVVMPGFFPGGQTSTVTFTVTSQLDATVSISGTVNVTQDIFNLFSVSIVAFPADDMGEEGDVIHVEVGVRNDGSVPDAYTMSVASSLGWQITSQPNYQFADVGQTVYLSFDVTLPALSGPFDETDVFNFKVYSATVPSAADSGSMPIVNTVPTDIEENPGGSLPNGFALYQNYPNPFNPTTVISFSLPLSANTRLEVINTLGQRVDERSLGRLTAGSHEVEYDASALASGVYFYRIIAGNHSQVRKMTLLK